MRIIILYSFSQKLISQVLAEPEAQVFQRKIPIARGAYKKQINHMHWATVVFQLTNYQVIFVYLSYGESSVIQYHNRYCSDHKRCPVDWYNSNEFLQNQRMSRRSNICTVHCAGKPGIYPLLRFCCIWHIYYMLDCKSKQWRPSQTIASIIKWRMLSSTG